MVIDRFGFSAEGVAVTAMGRFPAAGTAEQVRRPAPR